MESRSDCFCWEIMRCNNSNGCPARKNPERHCWEIAREKDDDHRNYFAICRDCIVHILLTENSVLTNWEIRNIVEAKTGAKLVPKNDWYPLFSAYMQPPPE